MYEVIKMIWISKDNGFRQNHEQREKTQRLFHEKVGRLTKTIQDMGNPFQEDSGDLLTLDT